VAPKKICFALTGLHPTRRARLNFAVDSLECSYFVASRREIPRGTGQHHRGDPFMKFAVTIEYVKDKDKIKENRPAHRQYLAQLFQKGLLAASGPFTDDSGALIIYEAKTKEEAERILKADPFHQKGVFVKWDIKPWQVVISRRQLWPASGKQAQELAAKAKQDQAQGEPKP
jgi:uncharacterized protein YciI